MRSNPDRSSVEVGDVVVERKGVHEAHRMNAHRTVCLRLAEISSRPKRERTAKTSETPQTLKF